jgi:hypothetical protein
LQKVSPTTLTWHAEKVNRNAHVQHLIGDTLLVVGCR